MKIILCATLAGLLSTPLLAQENAEPQGDMCQRVFDVAKAIMQNRQFGTEMPAVMNVAKGNPFEEAIVKMAFDEPRYSTEEMQQGAITDFANATYAGCLKARDKRAPQ